jgi:hypothetical protein
VQNANQSGSRVCRAPGSIALYGLMVGSLLSGCTSVEGRQKRLTPSYLTKFGAVCPTEDQLQAPHPAETNGAYRDRVMMVCIKAINGRYAEFVGELSTESNGINLIANVTSQTLATAASLVTKARLARELAAGSALATGLNGAVNKELFYKQALPAIIASMDAKRSKVLTGIVQSQNSDPEAKTYTLARAGPDLDTYQDAGSLTTAVLELTDAAVDNATAASEQLQQAERTIAIGTFNPRTPLAIMDRERQSADFIISLADDDQTAALNAISASLNAASLEADATAGDLSAAIRIKNHEVTTLPEDQQGARMLSIETELKKFGYKGPAQ